MQIKQCLRNGRPLRLAALAVLSFVLSLALTTSASGAPWSTVGPYGGSVRSLMPEPGNPRHLYLGTTSSWIYQSQDGGSSWSRLARLGKEDDLVVDNIVVDSSDPKTLVIGVFQVGEKGGGIYISHDSGKTWTASPSMAGQSVRALAQAPSNPKLFIAGTLSGVFRSTDGGAQWSRISEEGSTELREVESVAIDPTDPKTIYAGTWHLPWKTTDGGEHWSNVKEGLIDDSDVFSIIIDPGAPSIVYASACSGIYKSLNGGALFRKVQGIPSTARRTRVLMQDPSQRQIVYAGTTEGLYKTADGGTNWSRLTGPDVIINDVFVDPRNGQHLLLATDRSGVLESEDGGATFQGSNTGFSQRQVESVLLDRKQPATIYAGVLNDKIYGGVFISQDGGQQWQQHSDGLEGRDVFTLAQADDGTVLAGTEHGIFRWDGSRWQPDGSTVTVTEKKVRVRAANHHQSTAAHSAKSAPAKSAKTSAAQAGKKEAGATQIVEQAVVTKGSPIDARINQLTLTGSAWFAATSAGVYRSVDQGQSWQNSGVEPGDYAFVNAQAQTVIAARRNSLMLSPDGGQTWRNVALPSRMSGINALAVAGNGSVWVGGRQGLFYTDDGGAKWKTIERLPLGEITGLDFDADLQRVLVTSRSSTIIFGVDGTTAQWKWWDAGWKVHEVHSKNGRLVGASLFDGVVVEPEPSAGNPGAEQ